MGSTTGERRDSRPARVKRPQISRDGGPGTSRTIPALDAAARVGRVVSGVASVVTGADQQAGEPERHGHARVVVIGAINVDLVVRGDRLPGPGETVVGGAFSQHHGGKGGNQAVAAARALRGGRLEGSVAMVGAVGDDQFGHDALAALLVEGIDCSAVHVRSGVSTGVAVICVDGHGNNQISVAPGANATITAGEVEAALTRLLGPESVLIGSLEVPIDATLAGAFVASTIGARFVLNPAPARVVPVALVRLARYVTPNRGELDELVPIFAGLPSEQIRALTTADRGLGVAVTLGPDGVLASGPDGDSLFHALEVTPVDATGAGDAFNGALAAALAEGRPFLEAVRRGRTASGLATTTAGAREGMPTRREIDRAKEPR
jgi:ribokinase